MSEQSHKESDPCRKQEAVGVEDVAEVGSHCSWSK